ncbi:MAG: hypothetical protein OXU61_08395 [Gammaproteobacteria bacterium]|nr:hypothetical protein [Gammaproteobacteria bacterium]
MRACYGGRAPPLRGAVAKARLYDGIVARSAGASGVRDGSGRGRIGPSCRKNRNAGKGRKPIVASRRARRRPPCTPCWN